jgi:hypothetical protein
MSDDMEEEESGSTGDGRQEQSVSRHYNGRLRFESPSREVGKDAKKARAADCTKERSKTCLQEMGKDSGIFVGFLPCDPESDEKDLQERMHVVVQSKADRLVLPLPPLPSPISLDCDTSSSLSDSRSAATYVERRTYIDGVTALTDMQIQDGCAFISKAKQMPLDGAESPLRVKILSPRSRPEDAMSLAICYLAYSSSPSMSGPSHSAPAPLSPASDGDTSTAGAARLIPFGSTSTQKQVTRLNRRLSFPGSWDDEFVEIDVVNSSAPSNSNATFKEPSYTRAHALYMHLLDDAEDVDSERGFFWDDAAEDMFNDGAGDVPLGSGVPECSGRGESDGEQRVNSEPSTPSVSGAQGSASNRRLNREHGRNRERGRAGGKEYSCVHAEWRGVLSFDGLTKLDKVWLG